MIKEELGELQVSLKEEKINVFNIHLSYSLKSNKKIYLFNNEGALVYQQVVWMNEPTFVMNLKRNFAAGTYYLKLVGFSLKKLVIQ